MALTHLLAAALLELIVPEGPVVAGRTTPVAIALLDSDRALVDDPGTPAFEAGAGMGATATAPVKIAPGLWSVDLLPAKTGALALRVKLGEASGARELRVEAPATITVTLSHRDVRADAPPVVTATIEAKDGGGAPLDEPAPVLETTVGSIAAPVRVAPGKWTARVRLPEKRHPQVQLVVATIPGAVGAARLDIAARATVAITTEPKAKVTVRVGKKSFGPFTGDVYGEVKAQVDAGPQDTTMEVESTDSAGNTSTRTLPLSSPSYPKLWAKAEASPAWLDGRSRVTVRAASALRGVPVINPMGAPLVPVSNAFISESWLSLPAGPAKLTATADGDRRDLILTITAAPPVAIKLTATPDAISATGAPTAVAAELADARGVPVAVGTISFGADGIALGKLRNTPGRAEATASLVKGTKPGAAAVLARADGGGFRISARRVLPILAGPPAKLEFVGDTPALVADGASEIEVAVRITDAEGYPVTGIAPVLEAAPGLASAAVETGDGGYTFKLRAPAAAAAGSAILVLSAGGARAERPVRYLRPPTRHAMAVGFGGQNNLGALSSMVGWLEARRGVGGTDAPWSLALRLSGKQGGFTVNEAGERYDIAVTQGVLYAGVRRRFAPAMSRWGFFATGFAGAGVVQVKQSPTGYADGGPVIAARAGAAAERTVGRGAIVLDVGYEFATATDSSLIKGPLAGPDLTIGYRHGF